MNSETEAAFLSYINSLALKYKCKIDFDMATNTIYISAPIEMEEVIAMEISETWADNLV